MAARASVAERLMSSDGYAISMDTEVIDAAFVCGSIAEPNGILVHNRPIHG
jgi:hypothetical protein